MIRRLSLGALIAAAVVCTDWFVTAAGFVWPSWVYLAAAALVAWRLLGREPRRFAPAGALVALIVVLHFWPMAARKQFVRQARRVTIAMNPSEVGALMAGFETGHPIGGFLEREDCLYWRHGKEPTSFDHLCVRIGPGGGVSSATLVLD